MHETITTLVILIKIFLLAHYSPPESQQLFSNLNLESVVFEEQFLKDSVNPFIKINEIQERSQDLAQSLASPINTGNKVQGTVLGSIYANQSSNGAIEASATISQITPSYNPYNGSYVWSG